MFPIDGAPLMVHSLMNLVVLGLMLFACIGAFVKKRRLLCVGLLLLSLCGFVWAAMTTYPSLHTQLAEWSPSLSWWLVPILDLVQAAGWGCLVISVFKMKPSTPEVSS